MTQPGRPRITLRRTVPFDLDAGDGRLQLTINDLQPDPDRAVLGLSGPGVNQRTPARVGDTVQLGPGRWVVDAITPGDRGSVVLLGEL